MSVSHAFFPLMPLILQHKADQQRETFLALGQNVLQSSLFNIETRQ
jgi:hypothetical protein